MDKPNLYERALNGVEEVVNRVSESISKDFKDTKPFDTDEIPMKDMVKYYQSLSEDDMYWLIGKHGEEKVNDLIFEMETYLRRYGGGNGNG